MVASHEIILDGPSPLNGGRMAFHMFALPRLLFGRAGSSQEAILGHMQKVPDYFRDWNKAFWGHLCLSCRQHVYEYFTLEEIRVGYLLSIFNYREEYRQCQSLFDDNKAAWLPVHRDTEDILDHPNHIAKYVLGNLDHVKRQIKGEPLRKALSESSFDKFVATFKIENYVRNFI